MKKYIKFNGITFSSDTSYPFYSFFPNEGSVDYQTDKAVQLDGAIISNARYNERIVSLQGHIVGVTEEELRENRQKLFLKCNGKTKETLEYCDGYNTYFSEAIAGIPTLSEKRGLSYEFNINFTLPRFYWFDSVKTSIPIFKRENTILDTFTLPCVFTKRAAGAEVYNETDFAILPRVEFVATSDGAYNLIIKNVTTGASVELLNYTLQSGDVVTIDLEKVTALRNGESIINSFNDFTDFSIIAGLNNITVENNGSELNSTIMIYYNERMIGI